MPKLFTEKLVKFLDEYGFEMDQANESDYPAMILKYDEVPLDILNHFKFFQSQEILTHPTYGNLCIRSAAGMSELYLCILWDRG